ncbi:MULTISPECIES: YhgE/Pip family protein [Staphylococcus]|uniref:YhgE/Pip family protein n=1 Tax=Staphylococcus hsinchuensis TaxID=3051183 RepID=A0ABZ3EEZ3_9STAP|nr:YhgE/Pip family protein [Staphylococcus sp. Marseille-Q6910]
MFNELKFILRNKMLLVSLIAIALVSTIYVALFVGSIYNPYEKTENLKISIVNHDKPAKLNGKKVTIGDDLVDKLKDKDNFKFQEVSEKKAADQLKTGEATGTIIIPENASQNATTLLNKHPKKINLETQVNPGSSYTGSQISQKAINTVTDSIKQNIRSNYLEDMFASASKSKSGNQDMSDALGKMSHSESKLLSGNQQVTDGLKQLEPQVGQPAQKLISGNQDVTDGLNQLKKNNDELKSKLDNSIAQQNGTYLEKNNEKAINEVTKTTENNPTSVDHYGESIVPYMASVSLFVVALSFSAVYPLRKTITKDVSPLKQLTGKFTLYVIQGAVAALLMSCWVIFALQMPIDRVGLFFLNGMVWGITAITITSFLVLLLDRIGLFLSMILLVLQLSSSEGMFPIDLSAKFFKVINPFSPMSYAIQGYREAIFTNAGHYSYTVVMIVLISIIIVMMILQFIVLTWFHKREKLPFTMNFK